MTKYKVRIGAGETKTLILEATGETDAKEQAQEIIDTKYAHKEHWMIQYVCPIIE